MTQLKDIGFQEEVTTQTELTTALDGKVDKVSGKQLSQEDYTTAEKSKLAGIEAGAEVNNISDVNATDLTDGGDTTLHTHDSRYYTEGETDTLLSAKANDIEVVKLTGTQSVSGTKTFSDIVASNIKITTGTPGVGKVLISDASGNATWSTPSVGTGDMVKATYDPANKNRQLAADDEVVKLTGNQTVSGYKTFNNSIVSNQFILLRNDGDSVIFFQKDNSISRWALFKNSLQDFVLNRFDNSGVYVDNPLYVKGSNGNIGINETNPDYKLDVNGSFGFTPGIGTTITPVDNGDIVFEATSNTSLTVKMKGSDGVIRSTTLTLS